MDFTIAVLEGALASSVAITLDTLTAASRLSAIRGGPPLGWQVVGSGPQVTMSNGMSLAAIPLAPDLPLDTSVLVIPGLALIAHPGQPYDPAALGQRVEQADATTLAKLAADHHRQGGTVAAGCSGVFVLGQAGLLEGRSATTHWRLSGYLQQRYPGCRVDVHHMVLAQARVVSAGAALAQMDLMLHLVRERLGMQVADLTLRYLLLDERPSQAGYMLWSQLHDNDPTVQGLEALVEESLPEVPPLGVLADKLHVSPKTLARRVRRATGKSALALVQAVRLRRARHLLETTDLPLGEVAARVGYGDATALRKLTLRALKVTPGRLRRRRAGPSGPNV